MPCKKMCLNINAIDLFFQPVIIATRVNCNRIIIINVTINIIIRIIIINVTFFMLTLEVQSSKLKKHRYMMAYVFQKYPENFPFQLFIILQ